MAELLNSSQAIILGGGLEVADDGQAALTLASLQRAERAVEHYRNNPTWFNREGSVIVCSGGASWLSNETYSRSEGSLMADVLVRAEVPHRLIEKEEASHDTLSNFFNSTPFFDLDYVDEQSPLSVITQPVHYPRANFYGKLVLGAPTQNVEAPGLDDLRRKAQEATLRLMARTFFAGVQDGDREKIEQRAELMRRSLDVFKLPLRLIWK
ncbi:MAG TPA: YdcF family protein [Candidatus Saccharimonadales bacterium]|nr:YdcF family protein [Candidatus Saccharimonadales bacterium]